MRKSSANSEQDDSGNTGSQAKKRRGRPRKHAKLIEDDSHIELVGGTSKSNTQDNANEISLRPVGDLNN